MPRKWKAKIFASEDENGLKIGGEGIVKINKTIIGGSGRHNFSKNTSEGRVKIIDEDIGTVELSKNVDGSKVTYVLPSWLRKTAALVACTLIGAEAHSRIPYNDVLYKFGVPIAAGVLTAIGVYKILSHKYRLL